MFSLWRTHSTHFEKEKKHNHWIQDRRLYIRLSSISSMVPDALGRVHTCEVFKENKKQIVVDPKERKREKFFISNFLTEKHFGSQM